MNQQLTSFGVELGRSKKPKVCVRSEDSCPSLKLAQIAGTVIQGRPCKSADSVASGQRKATITTDPAQFPSLSLFKADLAASAKAGISVDSALSLRKVSVLSLLLEN